MKAPVINAKVKHILAIIAALFNGIATIMIFELMFNTGNFSLGGIFLVICFALNTYLTVDYAFVLQDTLVSAGEIAVTDAAAKRMKLRAKKQASTNAAPQTPAKKRDVRKPMGAQVAAIETMKEPKPTKTESEKTK